MIVLRKFCSSLLLHFLCCCSVFCFSLSRITCSILSLLSFLLSFACCLASSFLYSRWYEVTNRLSRELRADPSGNCLSPPSLFSSGFVEGGLEDWGVAELESSSSSSRWSSRGGFVPSSSAWGRWILVVFFLLSCECARLHMNYLQYCGARAWQQGILWRAPTPWNFVLGTSLSLRSPPHSKFDRRRRTKSELRGSYGLPRMKESAGWSRSFILGLQIGNFLQHNGTGTFRVLSDLFQRQF